MKLTSSNKASNFNFPITNYVKVTIFGFALNGLWTLMGALIIPLLVSGVVEDSLKNTYLGLIMFAGLVLTILIQPIAGLISDKSGFSCGNQPCILFSIMSSVIIKKIKTRDLFLRTV